MRLTRNPTQKIIRTISSALSRPSNPIAPFGPVTDIPTSTTVPNRTVSRFYIPFSTQNNGQDITNPSL